MTVISPHASDGPRKTQKRNGLEISHESWYGWSARWQTALEVGPTFHPLEEACVSLQTRGSMKAKVENRRGLGFHKSCLSLGMWDSRWHLRFLFCAMGQWLIRSRRAIYVDKFINDHLGFENAKLGISAECYDVSWKGQRSPLGKERGGKITGDRRGTHRGAAISQSGEHHHEGLSVIKHLC